MASSSAGDADIFVTLQKLNRNGDIVFSPYHTFINDGHVAWGWLRASKRKSSQPVFACGDEVDHSYLEEDAQLLEPNVLVEMDVGIQPTATLFRKGETLRVVVQGHDFGKYGAECQVLRAGAGVNGDEKHTIFLEQSFLEVPVIPRDIS